MKFPKLTIRIIEGRYSFCHLLILVLDLLKILEIVFATANRFLIKNT